MFDCFFFSSVNYCRDHESSSFVSIVVDREFIVNVDFSRESIKIHIVREFLEVRMFARAFLFREFDKICNDRIVVHKLFLVIVDIV